MIKFLQILLLISAIFWNVGDFADVEDDYEYDAIGSNITEEELIGILEELDYDNITAEGVSDLLDLITNSTAVEGDHGVEDYDYNITGGEGILEEITDTVINKDTLYPNIDYQETFEKDEDLDIFKRDVNENIEEDDEVAIVWIPIVVEYDYEIVDTKDIFDMFDIVDTELDYQEDKNYKLFVQKALDSSVQFKSIYQEQRVFNIILLSGVALICLIVTFGLISLAISIFNRRASSTHPVRQVKLVNAGGIVKSYAKIPVEVKNMLPSNVAYRQLYDV